MKISWSWLVIIGVNATPLRILGQWYGGVSWELRFFRKICGLRVIVRFGGYFTGSVIDFLDESGFLGIYFPHLVG